jgi:hypothetical protein
MFAAALAHHDLQANRYDGLDLPLRISSTRR